MLETTVHVDAGIDAPDSGAEALNSTEFVPFARLGVINFESHILANLVCAASNNHHQWTQEKS